MSRKRIVAANWKMNLTQEESAALVDGILSRLPADLTCEVVIASPFLFTTELIRQLKASPVQPAAQNCYPEPSGAYTGEISAAMLGQVGVKYCLTGHSERRMVFGESNEFVKEKTEAILQAGMTPVFCCGESLAIREKKQHNSFVQKQVEESLFQFDSSVISDIVIAYEPIWAIGTGVTATPDQAQEMHAFIRSLLIEKYGPDTGDKVRILYGGSVKPDNAEVLFGQEDVDGGLVGGASLDADGFLAIIDAANR